MKRTKRLLSTLLALCMVLAMLPATAMAAPVAETGDGNDASLLPTERYTVLVLDHSGSMRNDPIEQMKATARKFCEKLGEDTAKDNNTTNYVAVVGFSTSPDKGSYFTANVNELYPVIDRMTAYGLTDIAGAMIEADRLMKSPEANTKEAKKIVRNVVLLSDGLPEGNGSLADGRYTKMGYTGYGAQRANKCYADLEKAGVLNNGLYNIHTLGFFHGLSGTSRELCRQLLKDIATQSIFYEISNSEQMNVVLGDFILESIIDNPVDPKENFDAATDSHVTIKFTGPVCIAVRRAGSKPVELFNSLDTRSPLLGDLYGTIDETFKEDESGNPVSSEITLKLNNQYSYYITLTAYGDGKVTAEWSNSSVARAATGTADFDVVKDAVYPFMVKKATDSSGADVISPDATIPQVDIDDESNYFAFVPTTVGGTVVLSKHNAEEGDWVNIYVTPDEGYELASITVTDVRGWPVILREMGENAFSFTMPAARINVNPVFVKVEEDKGDYDYSLNVPEINNTDAPGYGAMVINPGAMNYSDVNAGDWFYDNVKFAHERYLLTGTGEADGKFEPNANATRASIWVAISRMAGRNTMNQGDNWYDRAQVWAKGKGITDGERPMGELTREEFVTMLWRYDGNKYVNGASLSQFNDGSSVSWWAGEAVKWAAANGLLKGDNGNLNPQNNVTRAEVAAVLQRYIQNIH